jgi:hypothetical protein
MLYLWTASQASQVFAEMRRAGLIELLLAAPLDFRKVAPGAWWGLVRLFGLPIGIILLVHFVAVLSGARVGGVMIGYASGRVSEMLLTFIHAGSSLLMSGANLIALIWFGLWMGLVSRNSLLATLKTIAFVQIIPWLVITFAGAMVIPLLALAGGFRGGAAGGGVVGGGMKAVAAQPGQVPDEAHEWLPATRLRRYQWQKGVGALFMAGIFGGWLVIQWSNPVVRLLSVGLIGVTAWVLWRSVVDDLDRARGRQVTVTRATIRVTTPQGATQARFRDVAVARWVDVTDVPADARERAGLWLYDRHGQPLVQLDTRILADEPEARAFLGWARRRADLGFEVRWHDRAPLS